MAEFTPADLAIVIPTRERWDTLGRTLSGLSGQTVPGFETIIVVDGTDQNPPPLDASRVLAKGRAGPGAARNFGARATERPLVMFLGDDTIPAPDLVERHLDVHCRHPERESAAVGFVDWHCEVAHNRINRWLEWSGTQSWYESLAKEGEQEVSHWFFYTSNISIKREFLLQDDGFDEDFPFAAFEDLECGVRLSHLGLRLYYEPAAICHHLHDYDWPGLKRRFACMAMSERLMVEKHPDIEPGCLARLKAAESRNPLPLEGFVGLVPRQWTALDRFVRRHADLRYNRRLAPVYFDAWNRAAELCELRHYLADTYDSARLVYQSRLSPGEGGEGGRSEAEKPGDERLYELARRALEGRTDKALSILQRFLPPDSRVLEFACGIGSTGLHLAKAGYSVQFADHRGRPLAYLQWRLEHRNLPLPVYELGVDDLPDDLDAVVCLDASQDRDPLALLHQLEHVAPKVALGFFDPAQGSSASLPAGLLTASSGRSRLVGRHDLPEGSVLLLYERDKAGIRSRVDPTMERWEDPTERQR